MQCIFTESTVLKVSVNIFLFILMLKVSLPRHFLCARIYMFAFNKFTWRISSYFRLSRSRSCPERQNSSNIVRHVYLGCCTWLSSCCLLDLLKAESRLGHTSQGPGQKLGESKQMLFIGRGLVAAGASVVIIQSQIWKRQTLAMQSPYIDAVVHKV